MRHILRGAAVIFILAFAGPAFSHSRLTFQADVEVEIVSDTGTVFKSILHQDLNNKSTRTVKSYLEAKKGRNYGIMIRNKTPERIGVVIAVDGRNIISGKRSDLKKDENMYILSPHEYTRYDGWRTSHTEVHKFYFTSPQDSYSIRTFSDSSAIGVIAVAVYREKKRSQPLFDHSKREASPPGPSARSLAPGKGPADDAAGTGFGNAQYSPVRKVEFEPDPVPVRKTLIKYEWRETLCRNGILRCEDETGNRLWGNEAYAPYPPGYSESR